jgi:SpoIIAA-like
MSVSASVSSIEWVRHIVFAGTVTENDLNAACDTVTRCLLDPSMDLLVDTTGVERVAATTDALRTLASRRREDALRAGATPPRVAVVAPDARVFGIARMYEAMRDSASGVANYFVCRTLAEARRWLGLSDGMSSASLPFVRA